MRDVASDPLAAWPFGSSGLQFMADAAPSRRRALQHAAFQEIVDVAQRRVGRAFRQRRPLAAGELAFKSIQQSVQHFDLAFIQGGALYALPEPGLAQHGIQRAMGLAYGLIQHIEEPAQPFGDVRRALLCGVRLFRPLELGSHWVRRRQENQGQETSLVFGTRPSRIHFPFSGR